MVRPEALGGWMIKRWCMWQVRLLCANYVLSDGMLDEDGSVEIRTYPRLRHLYADARSES